MFGKISVALLLIFLLPSCEGHVVKSSSQGQLETIDCGNSYISFEVKGRYQCSKYELTKGNSTTGSFQIFNVSGVSGDGDGISGQVQKAMTSNSGYSFRVTDGAEESIHSYNPDTRAGQNWSAVTSAGNAKLARFTYNGRNCFGFYVAGGLNRSNTGYDYLKLGNICREAGRAPYTNEELRSLVDKFEVRSTLPEVLTVSSPSPQQTKAVQPIMPSSAIADFAAKVKALKDAHDQGSISDAEFETKKKALLDAM